ncbi:MAG: FHA domain-containing protein [Clostridiaceae bacterium]|nr:FHA domain-containing protein [Clostridiaceae bacterium]
MKQNSSLQKAGSGMKKFINSKRVEKYSQNTNNIIWIMVIDIAIAIISILTLWYVYFVNEDKTLKYIGYGLIAVALVFFGIRIFTLISKAKSKGGISKLILIGEDGRSLKTWNIVGKVSFLIGRNTKDNEVDIDLSDAEYSELVSRQHAVLNFSEGKWYIEDVGSSYGSGLKKVDEEKFKLENERLYEINSGDTLYIANTKILVK